MAPKAQRSIRISLFYLISIFGIVLAAVFILISTFLVVRDINIQVEQSLVLETTRTNAVMGDYFGKIRQVVEYLAQDSAFAEPDRTASTRDELKVQLEKFRATFGFMFVYYGLESDGSAINYEAPPGWDARKRPWYQTAVAKDKLAITDPYVDAATGVLVTTVVKAVNGPAGRMGVLAIDSSLKNIVDLVFSKSELFASAFNLIVGADGKVLIARDQALQGVIFPVGQYKNGQSLYRLDFNGAPRIASILLNQETGYFVVSLLDPTEITDPAINLILVLLVIIVLILSLFIVIMNRIIARLIIRPITEIAGDMKKIQSLDLDGSIMRGGSTYEIVLMQNALDNMKKGLRSFRKYVPSDVVNQLLQRDAEASLGAEKRQLSIMFSDIADFTTISEKYPPDKLAEYLGHYFNGMTGTLQDNHATVDKFIGDAIMSFWGAPQDVENHAWLACKSALECMEFLAKTRREGLIPDFRTRIGINSGEAIVGNMGYEKRMSYTAIGDNVNVASRFEGLNKVYGTSIVVTEATWELTKNDFVFRELDTVVVKGKTKGMKVYELMAFKERFGAAELAWLDRYNLALAAYHRRDWAASHELFNALRDPARPDKPLEIMLKRVFGFLKDPPPADWAGEVYLRDK